MKLKDSLGHYQYSSGKASDISRQLAFAGIALVWIFKTGDPAHVAVPEELRRPTLFMVIALSFDFLQYVSGAAIWGLYNRHMEKRIADDVEFRAPPQLNWPMNACFWLKLTSLAIGYVFILSFLIKLTF